MRPKALFRGLIAAGVHPEVLRHTLLTAVTDHFLAYGHSMIFVQKAFELLSQIGWQEADAVLSPLVPEMVYGTRYDKLPYMRKFLRAWEQASPDLEALTARRGPGDGQRPSTRPAMARPDRRLARGRAQRARDGPRRRRRHQGRDRRHRPGRRRAADQVRHRAGPRRHQRVGLAGRHPYADLPERPALGLVGRPVRRRCCAACSTPPGSCSGRASSTCAGSHRRPAAQAASDQRCERGQPRDLPAAIPRPRSPWSTGYTGPREELERSLIQVAAEDHSATPIMVAHVIKTAQAAVAESRALGERPGLGPPDRGGGQIHREPQARAVRAPVDPGGHHHAARRPQGRIGPGAHPKGRKYGNGTTRDQVNLYTPMSRACPNNGVYAQFGVDEGGPAGCGDESSPARSLPHSARSWPSPR